MLNSDGVSTQGAYCAALQMFIENGRVVYDPFEMAVVIDMTKKVEAIK